LGLLVVRRDDSPHKVSELLCGSVYLSAKLYEKKKGLALMKKELF
jgi:hypothetical protein